MRNTNPDCPGAPSTHVAAIPAEARDLAASLAALFERDHQITKRLNDAQSRLRSANQRLWSGLHPDALALLYEDTHVTGIAADGRIRSEVSAAMIDQLRNGADHQQLETAVLAIVQETHWTIHRAFIDHQHASGAPSARSGRRRTRPSAHGHVNRGWLDRTPSTQRERPRPRQRDRGP